MGMAWLYINFMTEKIVKKQTKIQTGRARVDRNLPFPQPLAKDRFPPLPWVPVPPQEEGSAGSFPETAAGNRNLVPRAFSLTWGPGAKAQSQGKALGTRLR